MAAQAATAAQETTSYPSPLTGPAPTGAWTRGDWAIAATLFLIGLAFALIVAPQWLDPQDDGLYMHQAGIIMRGGVPYRDFLLHDAPLGNAWHALLLSLFGYDALVLRLAIVPFKALMLPAIYALTRPLAPRFPSLLAGLVVPIIDNNTFYTVAHVALNAEALGLGALVMLACQACRPHMGWLVGAGALLGIMAGFKQNMGLYLLGAAALWLLDPGPAGGEDTGQADARNMAWLRGLAWAGAAASALWLVKATPDPGVFASLVLPIAALALLSVRARPASRGMLRRSLARVGALLAGFAATALPWLAWVVAGAGPGTVWQGLVIGPSGLAGVWFAPLRPPVDAFWWLVALYAGGVFLAAALLSLCRLLGTERWAGLITWGGLALWGLGLLFLSPLTRLAFTGLIYAWLYFNILVFWPLLALVERLPLGPARQHARLLLISAALVALEMYPQLRRINANWSFVLFLPLVAWALWRAAVALGGLAPRRASERIKAAPAAALCLLPLLAFLWILNWRAAMVYDVPASLRAGRPVPVEWSVLDLPGFHLLDTPENRVYYRQVNDAITTRTRPGEPIYCLYRQIAFYISTGRPPAARDVYSPPGNTQKDAIAIRDQVERAGVRVVLVDNDILDPKGIRDYLLPGKTATWAIPLRDYLTANFYQVEPLDRWSLWERNP